ncbi:hypothetical protein B0H14DRAFT_2482333 [Mycena olivaceomarginata]|nr:hypothetical protein B0H14DRAFT_2482333 [Mycena olivaceomarginata]
MGPVALLPTGSVFLDLAPGKTVPRFDPVSQVDSFIPAMLAYAAYVNTTYPYLTLSYENLPYPLPSELLEAWSPSRSLRRGTISPPCCSSSTESRRTLGTCGRCRLTMASTLLTPNSSMRSSRVLLTLRRATSRISTTPLPRTWARRMCSSTAPSLTLTAPAHALEYKKPQSASYPPSHRYHRQQNVTTLIKAHKLLIAIPPSLRTLTAAHLDLDAHERFLFAKLHGLTYGVTVFSYPGLNSNNTYNNIGTHTPYNLLTLPGAFSYSPLPVGRFVSGFGTLEDHGFLDDDVEALIRGEITARPRANPTT